jgi:hypothetical protein
VGVVKGAGDVPEDAEVPPGLLEEGRDLPLLLRLPEMVPERRPLEELHAHVEFAGDAAHFVDGDDVRVAQARGAPGLLEERGVARLGVREAGRALGASRVDPLEGDELAQVVVPRAVNDSGAAAADLVDERVLPEFPRAVLRRLLHFARHGLAADEDDRIVADLDVAGLAGGDEGAPAPDAVDLADVGAPLDVDLDVAPGAVEDRLRLLGERGDDLFPREKTARDQELAEPGDVVQPRAGHLALDAETFRERGFRDEPVAHQELAEVKRLDRRRGLQFPYSGSGHD